MLRRRNSFDPESRSGKGRAGDVPTEIRAIFDAMATVYAVANQKGGVGKTTTAVNMAACVAEAGFRTLLVDLDPQCNATVALGVGKDLTPNTYSCLLGD